MEEERWKKTTGHDMNRFPLYHSGTITLVHTQSYACTTTSFEDRVVLPVMRDKAMT